MGTRSYCAKCGGRNFEYAGNWEDGTRFERCFCKDCNEETPVIEKWVDTRSPYERCRDAVYATGNRWAIENFNATH